jgi:tetratricopeptide (TPR) repeat protein
MLFLLVVLLTLCFIKRKAPSLKQSLYLFKKKDYLGAKSLLEEALEKKPKRIELYYHLYAKVLEKLNDFQQADNYFTFAIDLDSSNYLLYAGRGHLYALMGLYNDALSDLKESVSLRNDFHEPYYNMACVYALKGDTGSALVNMVHAFELGFNDFDHLLADETLSSLLSEKPFLDMLEYYRSKQIRQLH